MENTKKKIVGISLVAILLIIVIALTSLPLSVVMAEEYAMTSIGEAYYNGSKDKCRYEFFIDSETITTATSPILVSSNKFKLYFKGTECKRSIFTTFYFNISYSITREDRVVKNGKLEFAVNNEATALKDTRQVLSVDEIKLKFADIRGKYLITWHGTIKSAATERIDSQVNFIIF